ncbi:hypothetical protein GCM10023350_42660 [Nocardioides endophyticus]|uniref:EthD domain-containing protein n=1 Tax=Nocardioides endophyticus TaxID=1353775 RepID=A0ABP8ZCD8_9ACTN
MTTRSRSIRSVAPVRRRPELTWEEFSRHWREEHAAIARRMPGLAAYTQAHIDPEEQPAGRPHSWRHDGVPLATFADLAAIEMLRESPEYQEEAVPDEAAFTDRASMSPVLLVESFGGPPESRTSDGRTLFVFASTVGVDEGSGRRLVAALSAIPGAEVALAHRWSVALDADSGLGGREVPARSWDGMLEVWFPDVASARDVAGRIASDQRALPFPVSCTVGRENRVF